jgi:hypothetical protein
MNRDIVKRNCPVVPGLFLHAPAMIVVFRRTGPQGSAVLAAVATLVAVPSRKVALALDVPVESTLDRLASGFYEA